MPNIIMADQKGKIPARSAWFRPPDWPDYSQMDTSQFVKSSNLGDADHYCKCYFTCFTKHPTIRTFSASPDNYGVNSALLGHIENGVFVTDKNITAQLPYTFEADDPEYSCIFIEGYGYSNHRYIRIAGPVVEAFGYFDFTEMFNTSNACIVAPTIEAMTLWGKMNLGGMSTSINLQNLKYIDFTHATSMTIIGRFSESTAFQNFRTLAVCKLPDGIQNTSGLTGYPHSMFQYCESLGEINLKNIDLSGVTTFKNNFNGCTNLVSINLDGVDMSSVTTMSRAFTKCSALENISLIGTQLPGVAMSFSDSPLLTVETLNAIIAALPTVESAVTLTIGATNKAKLTEDEIAVATGKGWTVA